MSHEICDECGAADSYGSCSHLFDVLLALDHERRQPWAAYHSVNVACYLLQHPSQATSDVIAGQWHIVETFINEGLGAVHALAARAVRQNIARAGGEPDVVHRPLPEAVRPVDTTIADVSVDGTFPADGYEYRMVLWASATAYARGSTIS